MPDLIRGIFRFDGSGDTVMIGHDKSLVLKWMRLDPLCRITISRFYRDKAAFAALAEEVLPSLVPAVHERGDGALRIWSAGCGSGEEPYTLAVL